MIPYAYWALHADEDDLDGLPKKVTIHGHCWLCNAALFQVVYEPLEDGNTYIWHCEDCDVRERATRCSCGVEPANAA